MGDMIKEIEKKKNEVLEKLISKAPLKRVVKQRENSVKVTGFNPKYNEKDLEDIFEKAGKIRKVYISKDWVTKVNKNIAFIEYDQSISVTEAIERFNDEAYDNCVLCVTNTESN